jgi:hypothetical protein
MGTHKCGELRFLALIVPIREIRGHDHSALGERGGGRSDAGGALAGYCWMS